MKSRSSTSAGVLPASSAMTGPRGNAAAPRVWVWAVGWAVVLLAGLMLPQVLTSPFYLGLLVKGVMLGIAAVGIGFLMHQCGFVVFGAAAFTGLPAYLVGIGVMHFGMSTQLAAISALALTTLFAVMVGSVVVRARPLPFAMLTLALAQMLRSIATLQATRPLTGGDDGLSLTFKSGFLWLAPTDLSRAPAFWPLAFISLLLVLFITWRASTSRFGQVLRATQANEERMRFSGFNTYVPRLAAFTLATFIVALSGVLQVLHTGLASPELLDFNTGGHALIATLVGGASHVAGPLLGAMLYVWGQDSFGSTGYLELLTGLAVMFMIVAFPKGASGFIVQLWQLLQRKRGI